MTYLDKHLQGGMLSNRSEDWQPLLTYRNSLVQGDQEVEKLMTINRPGRPKANARGVKRKLPVEIGKRRFLEVVVQTTTYIQFAFVVLHSRGGGPGSWLMHFPYVVLHGIFGKF